MAGFYHTLQRKGLRIKWHFFATCHGKGVVDGLGRTVKRTVWGAVSTRNVCNVQDAVTFTKIAVQFSKSVNIQLYMSWERQWRLQQQPRTGQVLWTPILGISKIHCIEPAIKGQLHHCLYSSQPSTIHDTDHEQLSDGEEIQSPLC